MESEFERCNEALGLATSRPLQSSTIRTQGYPTPNPLASSKAYPLEGVRPILDKFEIEVLCAENSYVRCPGHDLHTTPNAESDCTIFCNKDGTIIAHCLHQSCRDRICELNAALAGFTRQRNATTPVWEQVKAARELAARSQAEKERERQNIKAALREIIRDHAWSAKAMMAESPEALDIPVGEHWKALIVSQFAPSDVLWCGRDKKDCGSPGHVFRFRPMGVWLGSFECPGPFTCPNPFNIGCYRRTNDNVAVRKHLVIESDKLSHAESGAIFRWLTSQVGMSLRAIVDTRNKSLHGWFDCPPPEQLRQLQASLPALGCDPAMFTPSQPCRLPGALRNGRYQRLLYLNPKPQ